MDDKKCVRWTNLVFRFLFLFCFYQPIGWDQCHVVCSWKISASEADIAYGLDAGEVEEGIIHTYVVCILHTQAAESTTICDKSVIFQSQFLCVLLLHWGESVSLCPTYYSASGRFERQEWKKTRLCLKCLCLHMILGFVIFKASSVPLRLSSFKRVRFICRYTDKIIRRQIVPNSLPQSQCNTIVQNLWKHRSKFNQFFFLFKYLRPLSIFMQQRNAIFRWMKTAINHKFRARMLSDSGDAIFAFVWYSEKNLPCFGVLPWMDLWFV